MITQRKFWRYVRGLAPPVLILGVFIAFLLNFLRSDQGYDEAAMQEWIEQTRNFHDTLPEMVRDYLHSLDQAKDKGDAFAFELSEKEEKIREHFKALGNVTKMYDGQLLLFLKLYRFTLTVTPTPGLQAKTIVWDSDLSRLSGQYRE